MKGILLAGGRGSRLYPLSEVSSKQLMPVYDKPMVYYPLSTLMLGGISDILLISTPEDLPHYRRLLKDGSQWGITIRYAEQQEPRGIAQAFLIAEDFLEGQPTCLILGDNIFYGYLDFLRNALGSFTDGGVIFGYRVQDPERYGVVDFDAQGRVVRIEEKPSNPRSNIAATGLYLFDGSVVQRAKKLQPSARGEVEITDLARSYLDEGTLRCVRLGRGIAWLDTGTPRSLLDASNFIAALEARQGLKVGCVEEVALHAGFLSRQAFLRLAQSLPASAYRRYLESLLDE